MRRSISEGCNGEGIRWRRLRVSSIEGRIMARRAGNFSDPLARITGMFVLLALAGARPGTSGELDGNVPGNAAAPPSLARYAVSDCALAVVVNPTRLLAKSPPELTELLRAGSKRLGYDPAHLRSLSGLFALGEDASLTFAAVVYASTLPIDGTRLLPREVSGGAVSEGRIQGKRCYWPTGQEPGRRLVACLPEERVALFSLESGIQKMLDGPDPKSRLAALLRRFPEDRDLVVAAVLPPLRPSIRRLRTLDPQMAEVTHFFRLAELAEFAVFRANLVGDETTELLLEAKDPRAAEELERLVLAGSDALRKYAQSMMSEKLQGRSELVAPAVERLLGKFQISRNRGQVTARCRAGNWLMHMLMTVGLMIEAANQPAALRARPEEKTPPQSR